VQESCFLLAKKTQKRGGVGGSRPPNNPPNKRKRKKQPTKKKHQGRGRWNPNHKPVGPTKKNPQNGEWGYLIERSRGFDILPPASHQIQTNSKNRKTNKHTRAVFRGGGCGGRKKKVSAKTGGGCCPKGFFQGGGGVWLGYPQNCLETPF